MKYIIKGHIIQSKLSYQKSYSVKKNGTYFVSILSLIFKILLTEVK